MNGRPMQTSDDVLLDIRNLHVEYLVEGGSIKAVDDVSFFVRRGEVFGLAGESGCGKSTIAHAILRVVRPPGLITGGHIYYKGIDLTELENTSPDEYWAKMSPQKGRKKPKRSRELIEDFRWAEVSMVFQSAMNALNPMTKVGDQIIDVILRHTDATAGDARRRAEELMEIVNIDKRRLDSYPHELSGGMRQRVVIAIALALRPSLMILDEPTTALDVVVEKDIMQQIAQLKKDYGFSILFITHDLSLLVDFSDRIGIMYAGQLVELAFARDILYNALHPYTRGLLSSFPSIRGPRIKLYGIPGAPPSLLSPPKGCRFQPRCPEWSAIEPNTPPVWREVAPDHWVACHRVRKAKDEQS